MPHIPSPTSASSSLPLSIDELEEALQRYRFRFSSESDLQDGIARVLEKSRFPFEREVTLRDMPERAVAGLKDRPDFMVDGIAVEVKIKGGLSALLRQISRYAMHPDVRGVIAVGSPSWLIQVPDSLCEKPTRGVRLMASLF